jgi:hypothetical protein
MGLARTSARWITVSFLLAIGCSDATTESSASDFAELSAKRCGNGVCNRNETCSSCAADCGPCASPDAGTPDAAPPPPPPPTSARGPQPDITCPAGSIDVAPGANLMAAVEAHPPGSSFCLRAGIHPITYETWPKSGDTFTGEYGAIMDGSGWSRTGTDYNTAAFRASNVDVDDVTIRNLVIRSMPRNGIGAFKDFSDRWTIDHNEIHHNYRTGVGPPNDSVVSHNLVHHNIGDVSSQIHAENGGGYGVFRARNVLFLDNEFYENGPEQKSSHSFNVVWRGNYFHHETYHSIWWDGDNPGGIAEDNLIEDSTTFGIFVEISQQIIVRRNTIRRAGWNSISLHTSRETEVYENVIEDCGRTAISLRVDCPNTGGGELAAKWDLTNNLIRDNVIRLPSTAGASATGLVAVNCTAEQLSAYLGNAKNNRWERNRYDVPTVDGAYWGWGVFPSSDVARTWSGWQALGQDLAGSVQ